MKVLRETIEEQGITIFQNAAGMSLDSFLELSLCVYLTATVVTHRDQIFVQKSGVCIGSRVAPYLSDVFLAACGISTQQMLKDPRIEVIFRYANDSLILRKEKTEEPSN